MNKSLMMPNWLATHYNNRAHDNAPDWLKCLQQKNWETFCQHGLPTKQQERWKYHDFSFLQDKNFLPAARVDTNEIFNIINQHRLQREDSILLVCINGSFYAELSDLAKLPTGVIVCSMHEAINQYPELVKKYWASGDDKAYLPWVNLNAAMDSEGLFCHLPDHLALAQPLHLLSLVIDNNEFVTHPKNIILLGQYSQLALVEEYFSLTEQTYLVNIVNTIILNQGAQLEQFTIQNQGQQAVHIAHTFVEQHQVSQFNRSTFAFGSQFARDDVIVNLQEKNTTCIAKGFYRLSADHQCIDHHIDINHLTSHTNSEMLYKGIIENDARAIFNGRLYVAKDAQKTVAYQANHNLLLSNHGEVYSKPELEIYADDVKCKHGATTGQLDQDALFYLCSRGIEKSAAIQLLLQAFADELVQQIKHPGIRMRIQEAMCNHD